MYSGLLVLLVITIALAILGFSLAIPVLKVLFWIALAVLIIGFIASFFTGPRRVPNV